MRKSIKIFDRIIAYFEQTILICALCLMIIVCAIQVINRTVINLGIIWSEEVLRILVVWTVCSGASVAAGRRQHLGVTFLVQKLPEYIAKRVVLATDILSIFVCVYIVVSGSSFVELQFRTNSFFSITRLPTPVAQLAVPICFSFMAFRIILTALEGFLKDKESSLSHTDDVEPAPPEKGRED